ncbi:MAG: hypothetical protein KDF60_19800 [Calditrichaeota bacterium]|nr:hypothetical protein [Calditrichota bacterium]
MAEKSKISKETADLLNFLEVNNISIYRFSKETGIPKDRVYQLNMQQWLRGIAHL